MENRQNCHYTAKEVTTMAKFKYDERIEYAWENADYCNCGSEDCNPNNHRKCPWCGGKMLYGYHASVPMHGESKYAWNIDHASARSKGGSNARSNIQAMHVECNREKGNK